MSQPPIESLDALLAALGKAQNLRERMSVLGQSWSLLRSLSPREREAVALRVGSNWAWKRIEKTFLRDGELDENERLIGRAFERMGDADPTELRQIARSIQDGNRGQARDSLIQTLTEILDGAAEEKERSHPAREPAVEVVGGAAPASSEHPVIRDSPVEPIPTTWPIEPSPTISSPPLAPTIESVVPRRVEPQREIPAFPAPEQYSPASEPEAFAFDPSPHSGSITSGAERLRILRELQSNDSAASAFGRRERQQLLESLGRGWASRRALSRMISAGFIDDLDEALEHIQNLERPGQQFWCLADLLTHWDLTESQIERVLGCTPSGAARRRLARRTRESGPMARRASATPRGSRLGAKQSRRGDRAQ